MNKSLWEKSNLMRKTKKMKENIDPLKPILPKINFLSWVMGFMMKMNRNKNYMKKFNKLGDNLPDKLNYKEFEKLFFKYFNKNSWKKEVFNFAFFLKY